jgi:hypothetical protein
LEQACGRPVHILSGVTGAGVDLVLRALQEAITEHRAASNHDADDAEPANDAPVAWQP